MNILTAIAADENVSPDLRRVLDPSRFTPEVRMQVYRRGLQCFDWNFAYIDDGQKYRRALERFDELLAEAREVDPLWATWNDIAPPKFRNGHKALS